MLQNQLFKLAARLAKPSASRVVGSISNAIRYQQGPSFSSLLSSRQPALYSAPALARSFKIKTAVKKMCPDCYLVRRKGRLWVYCRSNPKHKQKQA